MYLKRVADRLLVLVFFFFSVKQLLFKAEKFKSTQRPLTLFLHTFVNTERNLRVSFKLGLEFLCSYSADCVHAGSGKPAEINYHRVGPTVFMKLHSPAPVQSARLNGTG